MSPRKPRRLTKRERALLAIRSAAQAIVELTETDVDPDELRARAIGVFLLLDGRLRSLKNRQEIIQQLASAIADRLVAVDREWRELSEAERQSLKGS